MRKDPLFKVIDEKQEKINEENRLILKKKPSNPLVMGTSVILLVGILIGLIRIIIVTLY
jgi:hypothetical protein